MRGYEMRELHNGWIVGGAGFAEFYTDAPFPETYAATLGEALELIRKHAKRVGELTKRDTP